MPLHLDFDFRFHTFIVYNSSYGHENRDKSQLMTSEFIYFYNSTTCDCCVMVMMSEVTGMMTDRLRVKNDLTTEQQLLKNR